MKSAYILKLSVFILFFFFSGCDNKIDKTNKKTYTIEIKPTVDHSTLEKIFPYIKDIISMIAIIFGIVFGYPLLKKKLIENHISNALEKIQDTNRTVQEECQKLLDKYILLNYSLEVIDESKLQIVFDEIRKLNLAAQQSSSDVVTILYYLKNTLQGILRYFSQHNDKYKRITSRDLYNLTIKTLELTVFYCSKVVQVPNSAKIEEQNLINSKLKKFVINYHNKQYRNFNQGLITDARTTHLVIFYDLINKTDHPLIRKAAFSVFRHPAPLANLLFLNELYAPLVLERKYNSPIFGEITQVLFLIGFTLKTTYYTNSKEAKEVIELDYYSLDFIDFITKSNNLKDLFTSFNDAYIKDSNFSFDLNSIKQSSVKTITIQLDSVFLKEKFKSLKCKMEKQMKKIE